VRMLWSNALLFGGGLLIASLILAAVTVASRRRAQEAGGLEAGEAEKPEADYPPIHDYRRQQSRPAPTRAAQHDDARRKQLDALQTALFDQQERHQQELATAEARHARELAEARGVAKQKQAELAAALGELASSKAAARGLAEARALLAELEPQAARARRAEQQAADLLAGRAQLANELASTKEQLAAVFAEKSKLEQQARELATIKQQQAAEQQQEQGGPLPPAVLEALETYIRETPRPAVRMAREIVRRHGGIVGRDYPAFTACFEALVHAVHAFTEAKHAPLPPTTATPGTVNTPAENIAASSASAGEGEASREPVNGERPVNAGGKTVRERVNAMRRTMQRSQTKPKPRSKR
jgi:hypothetical protein